MQSCTKVKNPCKICLGGVTQKNGLQCKGACESWVHYKCLNYTPGRIKDIKAGIIKVTCPCPDCKTQLPKEFRTDEPFSCTNVQCPANRPPQCINSKCPTNAMSNLSDKKPSKKFANPLSCPLGSCGVECKQHISNPHLPSCNIPPCAPPGPLTTSLSDICLQPKGCPTGCSPSPLLPPLPAYPGSCQPPREPPSCIKSISAMEQMRNTIDMLSSQVHEMMKTMNAAGATRRACPPPPCSHVPKAASLKPCFCPGNPGTERKCVTKKTS